MSQSLFDIAQLIESDLKELGATIKKPKYIIPGYNKQFYITELKTNEFKLENIKDLSKQIFEFSSNVTFCELIIPKNGIEFAAVCCKNNILFRYIEVYSVADDRIFKRIDVLLEK